MLEWLKTPSGAYNLTLIVATGGWIIAGIGIFAGFHLNKMKTLEAQAKTQQAQVDRATVTSELEAARRKILETEIALKATSDELSQTKTSVTDTAERIKIRIEERMRIAELEKLIAEKQARVSRGSWMPHQWNEAHAEINKLQSELKQLQERQKAK